MSLLVTINVDGKTIKAIQEDFDVIKEGTSDYKLKDGTILKLRVTVAEIYKLDEKDPTTGKPNYLVKSSQIMSIVLPKKK